MHRSIFAAAIALGACMQEGSSQAAGPIQTLRVGNWSGGSYTNDRTGAFSHCVANAPYMSGISFFVSVNSSFQWSIGFASAAWQLVPGETIPVDLTFDGRSQYHVLATALTSQLAAIPMPNNSTLIRTFRGARQMGAVARGQLFGFDLNQTSMLLPALVDCVRKNVGLPVVARPAAPPPRTAPVVGTLATAAPIQPPAVSPSADTELQIEAINLATNFMIKSQVPNPQLLARQNMPTELASWGAAWKSDDAIGAVKIIPPQEGMKGIDLAAAVAASDAKNCTGKFLSGRTSDLVDSDVVFRGFATCEDSEGIRSGLYFIVPRKKGGFVLFSVMSSGKPGVSATATSDQKLPDYRKAALTSVSE